MPSSELLDWLALFLTPGLGIRGWHKLLAVFGDPKEILEAGHQTLRKQVPGLSDKVIAAIDKKALYPAAEKERERALKIGASIICLHDEAYPDLLRNIYDPPVILYVKGRVELLASTCVGMVGARASSVYGQRIAEDLAKRLTLQGVTVVSGLALGIDAAVHRGALRGAGDTIGVLGCGLDVVYPRQNKKIYDEMFCCGAVVSEYRLGSKPEAYRFPARNRIISGLSRGVVVVEAARKSGSLITARCALEQGRDVFAVPGRVDSLKSEGTHRLLQEGAKLVHTVDDILEELAGSYGVGHHSDAGIACEKKRDVPLVGEEEELFKFLDVYPQTIDEITTRCGKSVQKVNELLLMLELKGVVESLAGNLYQKKS